MTYHSIAKVKEVFLGATRVEGAERQAYLLHECQGDSSLREQVESLLSHLARDLPAFPALSEVDVEAPQRVGSYVLGAELGSGSMGVVYHASHSATGHEVAIKLMRHLLGGRTAEKRFEVECRILQRLDHPSIARIYESGVHLLGVDRLPYCAMEYVDGTPLTLWLTNHSLGVVEKVGLCEQLCEVVHYAHQNGVIHRDLKPDNVLMTTEGQPKLVDFGLGRIDEGKESRATTEGAPLGTLPYMSPEQALGRLDIDTRSDIYSLGVIACEILAGVPPHDLTGLPQIAAVSRVVSEEPASLRGLNPELDRDLSHIVGVALHKRREQRYATALDMARDFRRYLRREPVWARRAGWVYRARLSVRRRWRVLVAVFLASSMVTLLWAGWRFLDQRSKSELLGSFTEEAIEQRIDRCMWHLEYESFDREVLDEFFGKVHLAPFCPGVEDHLLKLYEISLARGSRAEVVLCAQRLAATLSVRGEFGRAREYYEAAERYEDPDALESVVLMLLAEGNFDEARERFGREPEAGVLVAAAELAFGGGAFERAIELYQRAKSRPETDKTSRVNIQTRVAGVLWRMGRYDEAVEFAERGLAEGGDPAAITAATSTLGVILRDRGAEGDGVLARKHLTEALARRREHNSAVGVAAALNNLARLEELIGAHPEAETMYANARRQGAGDRFVASESHLGLARVRLASGNLDGARYHAKLSLENRSLRLPQDHWLVGEAKCVLGICMSRDGDSEGAGLIADGMQAVERLGPDTRTLQVLRELQRGVR